MIGGSVGGTIIREISVPGGEIEFNHELDKNTMAGGVVLVPRDLFACV